MKKSKCPDCGQEYDKKGKCACNRKADGKKVAKKGKQDVGKKAPPFGKKKYGGAV